MSAAAAVAIRVDPRPDAAAFGALWQAAWDAPWTGDLDAIWSRSLVHLGAYDGGRLVGYLNLAWDGGAHGFLLDTTVHPQFRRRGIATRLVRRRLRKRGGANCTGCMSTTKRIWSASMPAAASGRRGRD